MKKGTLCYGCIGSYLYLVAKPLLPMPMIIPTKNLSKAGSVENYLMVFNDCSKLSTISGRNRVLEVSSCKADAVDRADDGQRVQDDRRHSQVMLVIMMAVIMTMMTEMVMLVMMAMMVMLLMWR